MNSKTRNRDSLCEAGIGNTMDSYRYAGSFFIDMLKITSFLNIQGFNKYRFYCQTFPSARKVRVKPSRRAVPFELSDLRRSGTLALFPALQATNGGYLVL